MRVENIEILKTENVKEQQLADMMSLTASLHLINKKIDILFISSLHMSCIYIH